MPADEVKSFLCYGTRTGMLATVKEDGGPHLAPVWFVVDGDELLFNTAEASVKARNLRREGRAAFSVDLAEPPYAFVLVEGSVSLDDDLTVVRDVARRNGARYMGADRADEYANRNGVEGELVVRLRMDKVTAFAEVSD